MIDKPCTYHANGKQAHGEGMSSQCAMCRREAVLMAEHDRGTRLDGYWRKEARIRRKYRRELAKTTNQLAD